MPHPYKDELSPLPSNEVIELVLKKRPKKKKQPVTSTLTTATGTDLPSIQTTPVAPSNPQHETRTEATVNQVLPVDVGPTGNSLVLSDDECSEYLDHLFEPLEILQQEQRQTRGKTFLPPKPAAVRTK